MSMSKRSIRGLEVLEVTARTGSLQATADEVELSISSVSHHLARTEAALGLVPIDRSWRPMVLTAAGTSSCAGSRRGCATSAPRAARARRAGSRRPARSRSGWWTTSRAASRPSSP